MLDGHGREIDYLRISVTDRCDLRCVYCMPEEGVSCMNHSDILTYEEILRIARCAASLGIHKIRVTGGEPLARLGIETLISGLKSIDGIKTVVLTTNGTHLAEKLPALKDAGLDGVNISIDAVNEEVFRRITRREGVDKVLRGIDAALACEGLRVKLNCVPTRMNEGQLALLARRFLRDNDISLRFIELMPIGMGGALEQMSEEQTRACLEAELGELHEIPGYDPREKCRYFGIDGYKGSVGFISAVSHKFCSDCNRVRLMSDGYLKTCLQYDDGVALREYLSGTDAELTQAMRNAILSKPACHHFSAEREQNDETRIMSQIGG